MESMNFLTPILEIGRELGSGRKTQTVMNLTTRRIAETLGAKGCLIRMQKPQDGPLETLSTFGLSESIIFADPESTPSSILGNVPAETVRISDLKDHTRIEEYDLLEDEGVLSLMVVPIQFEQQSKALTAVFREDVHAFTDEEVNFAEILASRIILTIMWERRVNELIKREQDLLHSFQEMSSAVGSTLTINRVLLLAANKITTVLKLLGTELRLVDAKTNELKLVASYGLSDAYLSKGKGTYDAYKSVPENMEGKTVVIEDVQHDPRVQFPREAAQEGIFKCLAIPLVAHEKVIGVARIYSGDRPTFSEREIQFAQALVHQCALAIENSRMYQRIKYEYQHLLEDMGYDGSS